MVARGEVTRAAIGAERSERSANEPKSLFRLSRDAQGTQPKHPIDALRAPLSGSGYYFNISQVRKRARYVQNVRSPGNAELLGLAIADTRDARTVLADKQLNPSTQKLLNSAETALRNAVNGREKDRPSAMAKLITLLDQANATLLTPPPDSGADG